MKKKLAVWKLISKSLQENVPVMLLYVLESFGSSPGREGFCMAVNAMGEMVGSIGGGIMEHKFVEMAKSKLKDNYEGYEIYKQIHDKASLQFQSGMICSGEQTNLVYRVRDEEFNAVNKIIGCIENNKSGQLTLSDTVMSFAEEIPEVDIRFERLGEKKEDWIYEEKIGYKNHLYIIGAGHCALALSKLMSTMDFCMHLYDDRESLNIFSENEFVQEKLIVKDYGELRTLIPPGSSQYVVVMTVGYRTDDTTVRALMDKEFKYFGILGSKKKIEKMFTTYREEGIDEALLAKIHAPVGVPVNSQTPEEIAISIAAQIIKVKNGQ
ncbi:MAG: xanthine and dehydrogenase maturation factor XdhC/CoxF family-like protein [Segetibacter sp.]|nr:xanthine and dehydrogenase maturation factor XdhC/CoxF family-like protein [Segetibacter sp.]